jgi:hypothetical protein
MATTTDLLTAARAEALFTSLLSMETSLSPGDVAAAIAHAVRTHGGARGCAAEVAAAYGEHPETAAPRMRWARAVVQAVYARSGPARLPAGPASTAAPLPG